jgi:hypothetical protein
MTRLAPLLQRPQSLVAAVQAASGLPLCVRRNASADDAARAAATETAIPCNSGASRVRLTAVSQWEHMRR